MLASLMLLIIIKFIIKDNGFSMSSHTIAEYLVELAANQRKLNYCREIIASNTLFNPPSLFQKYAQTHKNQITIAQFSHLLQDFSCSVGSEQSSLIFSHFQVEGKQFLTYDQFYQGLVPQGDQFFKKIIKNREKDDYQLDYSVKYALNKLFLQIYESQLSLEGKGNFEIQPDEVSAKKGFKAKIGVYQVQKYMNHHDKYPTKTMVEYIRSEINKNKGVNNRNMLVRDYITKYLNKIEFSKGQIPNIVICAPKLSAKIIGKKANSALIYKENISKQKITKCQASSKDRLNSIQKTTSSILGSINDVQSKIKDILTSVRVQPSALSLRSQRQQSLTHRSQLSSKKPSHNETISSVQDSVPSKPTIRPQVKRYAQAIKDLSNLSEKSIQRKGISPSKQQARQSSNRNPSSSKSTHKYGEDELEYRYRRFNYLKQEKRGSSRRKQNSSHIHEHTKVTRFAF